MSRTAIQRSLLALLAAVALVAAACGASGDEPAEGSGEGGSEESTTTVAEASEASWGDLTNLCGPGEATVSPGEGTSAPGTINIAVATDRGPDIRPGLNKELWDASVAFSEWCNAAGGIQGLQIELIDADGKLFEVESVMTTICTEAFAMVGGAFTQDDLEFSGKPGSDFHQCNMIDIPGFAVSPVKGLSNGLVQAVPNPPTKKSTAWLIDSATPVDPAFTHFVDVHPVDMPVRPPLHNRRPSPARKRSRPPAKNRSTAASTPEIGAGPQDRGGRRPQPRNRSVGSGRRVCPHAQN